MLRARRSASSPRTRSPRGPPRSTRPREFPWDVYDALRAAGFHAVHIPEEYGGAGADAVATVIVIEEVARVCASSSLIPAVNKLGTMPIMLSGIRGAQAAGAAAGRHRRGDVLLRAVRAGGRLGRRRDAHPGGPGRRRLGAQRHQVLDHQRRRLDLVHRDGGRPTRTQGAKGISAFVVHKDDPGFSVGTKERKLGIKGSPTWEIHFEDCRIPGDRIIGEPGTGFKTALATLDHTRPTIGAQAVGIAQGALDAPIAYVKERKQFGKPIAEFQGVQFMLADMAMQIEAARQLVYAAAAKAERGDAGPDLPVRRGQVLGVATSR